ncbi:hypothetical protein ACN93_15870 [Gordonia paraffinivorans]|nr:hypothetical protein ACN93_15870 [Gordonia paraffinivorans]
MSPSEPTTKLPGPESNPPPPSNLRASVQATGGSGRPPGFTGRRSATPKSPAGSCSGLLAMWAIDSIRFAGRPLRGVVVADRNAPQPSAPEVQAASALVSEMNAPSVDVAEPLGGEVRVVPRRPLTGSARLAAIIAAPRTPGARPAMLVPSRNCAIA